MLLETSAEAQVELGHAPRQVARQLRPASPQEEVDDSKVVGTAARGLERLGPGPRHVYAIALPAKDDGQRPATALVGLDEKDGTIGLHGGFRSNPRTRRKNGT